MNELNISIAGLGNVGSHLISTIIENKKFVKLKTDIEFNIIGISAKNKNKKRIFDINLFQWFENPLDLIKDNRCDILIELIGEENGVSYDLIKGALEKKIHVVTANKALLAKNGLELFKIAEKNNVLLLYEAAVAGGIPIIKILKNNIFLNKIKKISGILNGTTNYILTKMYEENLTFEKALEIAKSKGYTSDSESELDIGGLDSAHKLTILTTLCFGAVINFSTNQIKGISKIKIEDILSAKKFGYNIKLISEAFINNNNEIYCNTLPKLVSKKNPLGNVNGVLNAIKIETDQLSSLYLEGEGAGGKATASSVLSDLYEIYSNSNSLSLGYKVANLEEFNKVDFLEFESSYYLRIMTKDIAGVLSKITGFFEINNISIEKIIQIPENKKNLPIPIIIISHIVKTSKLLEIIKLIENQDFVLDKISFIPIDND